MIYDESNLRLAKKIFYTPVQEGMYFTKCKLCGETVIEGSRYEGEPVDSAMHHDCFYATIPERTPKFDLLEYLLNIQESEKPEVIIKKSLLEKLVDKAVDLFPFQHNFFSFGSSSYEEVTVEGFKNVPFFDYRVHCGEFSSYEFNTSDKALKELQRMVECNPNGYVHVHDSRKVGLSDVIYDKIYAVFLPIQVHGNFRVRMHLDTFFPTLKELVISNHKRFRGSESLVVDRGPSALPSRLLENYLNHDNAEYEKVLKDAKQKAKESILSDTKHLSAYKSLIIDFGSVSQIDFQRMVNETGILLENECKNEEEMANLELVNFVRGKIKKLPLVIA